MSSLRNAVSRRAHKERAQPWVNWIPLIEPFVYMIILHLLAMADLCFLFLFSQAFKEEIWASWKAQGLCRACTSIPQKGADFAGKVTDFVLLFSWCLADSQNQKNYIIYTYTYIPVNGLLFSFVFSLQKLKEKAAFRNPDEFYFRMIKTRNVDGVHKLE